MRFTWRDALATLLVAVGLAFGYSVVAGWGWPLMNGVRAGIIALGVAGFLACPIGWNTQEAEFFQNPSLSALRQAGMFFVVGTIVGGFLLVIGIVGLIAGTMPYLEWLLGGVAVMWLITLVHRLQPGAKSTRPSTA
jgi:hypothetical protein